MTLSTWWLFLAMTFVVSATPGPNMLLVMSTSARHCVRAAVLAMAGCMTALLIMMSLSAAGLGALLQSFPAVFDALRLTGAAYLAWLGFKMLTAKPGSAPILNIRPRQYFQQALTITLLNPKAIVFYMAFFPLFVDPATHRGLITFGAMAATIAALTFLYGLIVTLLTHHMAERLRANPRVSSGLEKLAGVFLIGFGIKLALSK